ncbi:MAG: cation transporter [Clostridia bacterium]|nr:cation transporter [Clostridia bacterium]
MTKLLCKLFVRDRDDVKNPRVRSAYATLTSVVGLLLNLFLFAAKLFAGTLARSVAICADAMNNLSDAASQLITLIGCRMAAKQADRAHPFGHARMEYITSLLVSLVIIIIGYELLGDSIDKILHPGAIEFHILTVVILVLSIAVKLWLGLFNRAVGKKINSEALRATMIDSLSDAAATLAVLFCMLLHRATGIDIDAYVGIAVAILIFVAGFRVLNDAKNAILGEAPSPEVLQEIRDVVAKYPDALGIHDMMVHNYGPGRTVASLHIEVDGNRNIFDMHDTIDRIEKQLLEEHGIAATVHMDPIVVGDAEVDALRERVVQLLKEIDARLAMHDFRYVRGNTHSNLIFDVAAPFELALADDEIRRRVDAAVRTIDPSFCTVITVDRA